jgi:hypothetical protein
MAAFGYESCWKKLQERSKKTFLTKFNSINNPRLLAHGFKHGKRHGIKSATDEKWHGGKSAPESFSYFTLMLIN